MKLLEDRIVKDGAVLAGDVLKVDSFLNHQMDVELFDEMAKEFKRLYDGCEITKILTIEASGIGIACSAAREFKCPVVFAKKSRTSNLDDSVYSAEVKSYTHGNTNNVLVSKKFISSSDKVLIIDDFLANGEALRGLMAIVKKAGAEVVGAGIAIEKAYQPGGREIRAQGVRVESLAKVASMDEKTGISFC